MTDADAVLTAWAEGRLPDGVAAMRLLDACGSGAEARIVAAGAGAGALRPLLTDEAHALVRGMLAVADHGSSGSPAEWAARFDRAAALSPEASVALYSLGDGERLAQATEEVVAWLAAEALVGPTRRVLEVGCGIGRFVAALAPLSAGVVGVDVSLGMIAEATRRISGLPDAVVMRTGGADLSAFADAAFDVVLAIDSWPYVVDAGVAGVMTREAARVLRPGGDFVVLNWSYRGDPEQDREEAARSAADAGLRRVADDGPVLRHWNGALFRFHKPGPGPAAA